MGRTDMKTTFYEILLVPPDADATLLRHAYEQSLATLARRLRVAREQAHATHDLEEERATLEEAWSVLSDPVRRARYDAFLAQADQPPPKDAGELWVRVAGAYLDPRSRAALELVRVLTDLPVARERIVPAPPAREATPAPAPPEAPRPAVASVRPSPEPPRPAVAPPTVAPLPAPAMAEAAPARVVLPPWQAPVPEAPPPEERSDLESLVLQHGWSGTLLRRVREGRGVSLKEVAESTRINERYLEAIEADDFSRLPATTFVRGYLKEVGRLLELDPELLVPGYLARMGRARG